ncbi:hypothetical protein ACFVXB_42830, partial [Streptomyces sp. NPDC058247]
MVTAPLLAAPEAGSGMFGHALGGDTAAETMAQDHRILAGADLDGSINGAVAATVVTRTGQPGWV